jgi:hypothetical protein
MISRKLLTLDFTCDCCGKEITKFYDLLDDDNASSKICPEDWHYIDNGSYQDALVCDKCWAIYNKVEDLIK